MRNGFRNSGVLTASHTNADSWIMGIGFPYVVGVQNEPPQDVSQWYVIILT